MIHQEYWKSETLTGKSIRVSRFFPSEISDLFEVFLRVVKPKEVTFVGKLLGPQAAAITRDYFLTIRGRRPADQTVRDWLTSNVKRLSSMSISPSGYRLFFLRFFFPLLFYFILFFSSLASQNDFLSNNYFFFFFCLPDIMQSG